METKVIPTKLDVFNMGELVVLCRDCHEKIHNIKKQLKTDGYDRKRNS